MHQLADVTAIMIDSFLAKGQVAVTCHAAKAQERSTYVVLYWSIAGKSVVMNLDTYIIGLPHYLTPLPNISPPHNISPLPFQCRLSAPGDFTLNTCPLCH